MGLADEEVLWERDEGSGYRTVVSILRYMDGGGDVHARLVGPRGGVTSIYSAYVSGDGGGAKRLREQISRQDEVKDWTLRALRRVESTLSPTETSER